MGMIFALPRASKFVIHAHDGSALAMQGLVLRELMAGNGFATLVFTLHLVTRARCGQMRIQILEQQHLLAFTSNGTKGTSWGMLVRFCAFALIRAAMRFVGTRNFLQWARSHMFYNLIVFARKCTRRKGALGIQIVNKSLNDAVGNQFVFFPWRRTRGALFMHVKPSLNTGATVQVVEAGGTWNCIFCNMIAYLAC